MGEQTWSVMYLWDVEISLLDLMLLLINVMFFVTVIILFVYYGRVEAKTPIKPIPLMPFCNFGEGLTGKYFSVKGNGKEAVQRRRPGSKSTLPPAKEGRNVSLNQVEVKCNFCKTGFNLSPKLK